MSASSSLLLVSTEKEVPRLRSVSSSVLRVKQMLSWMNLNVCLLGLYSKIVFYTHISLFLSLTLFMSTTPPVFSLKGSFCEKWRITKRHQPRLKEIKTLLTSISASGGSFSPTNSAVRLNTIEVMSNLYLVYHYMNVYIFTRLQTQCEFGCTYAIPDSGLPFPQTLKLFCLFNFRSKQPTKSRTTLTGETNE